MQNPFNKNKLLLWWIPITIAIIGCIASFYGRALLDNREHEYIRNIVRSDVSGVADKSARLTKESIGALQRIASRWTARGGTPKDEWIADMGNQVKHYSCFQAIEWIDPSFHVRWIAPLEGNEQSLDMDVSVEANHKAALEEAKNQNEFRITRTVDLVQGEKGCIIFVPLYAGARFDGFIAGVLNYRKLFATDMPETISSHYAITVYEGTERIFVLNASDYPDTTDLSQSADIAFNNNTWRFEASPLPGYISPTHTYLDEIFFPTGIAIAFLIAIITHFYQKKNLLEDEVRAVARLTSENPHPVIRIAHDGKVLFANKAGLFILDNCGCHTNKPCKVGDIVAGKWQEYIKKALATNDSFKEEEVASKHFFSLTFVPITEQKYVNIYGVNVTARRHVEEALATSEKRYRTLTEISPVGIFYTDVEGLWVYVNKQISVSTGMDMSETIGDGWMCALHPDDRQRVSQEWQKSIRGRTGFSSEYRFVKPTGETIWAYSQVTPEKDSTGAIVGYVGTVTDITERKQTEEKLRKITESAFDAIIMIDDNGIINYWNQAAETLFGYTQAEVLGKDVHKTVVPDGYTEDYQPGMMQYKATGTGNIIGKRVVLLAQKKDGTQFYAEHSFASFRSNNRWNALSIIRDCTVQKQYEEELKRLNETLEQHVSEKTKEIVSQNEKLVILSRAVEQSSTSIVITDAKGNIEYVNPQFIELTGYTQEEAKGQNPRILKSGQTPPERFKELWEAITTGETWHGEFINKKKNDEIYHELVTVSPIKNAKGEITHFVAIKNDVTTIKHLEAERKQLEDQLAHAQKLESIGKLAGGIAHDFNNMLMAVVGYSNLIEMELAEDNPIRSYTQKILGLTDKSKRLTQSLLTFGRRQPLYLSPIDLNAIIRDMEPLLFKSVGERIRCEMTLSDKSVAIKADSGKIEQVIMNIFINAVEAMPNGGHVTIRTDVTKLDDVRAKNFGLGANDEYALLSISDTGIGMDEAMQGKIFEPFFTTKVSGKGRGMGLSIAYGIIRQHNGALEVISEPNKGSTFNIYLPVSDEKPKESVAEANRLPPPLLSTLSKTILLAEDEEGVRESMTKVLRQKGFTVISAVDGEDAINKFKQNKDEIDLLLLDGIMPVKSGKEAYDSIKKIKPGIKALFMSGYTGDEEANRNIQEEGLRFLQKPVPLTELMDAIWKTMEA